MMEFGCTCFGSTWWYVVLGLTAYNVMKKRIICDWRKFKSTRSNGKVNFVCAEPSHLYFTLYNQFLRFSIIFKSERRFIFVRNIAKILFYIIWLSLLFRCLLIQDYLLKRRLLLDVNATGKNSNKLHFSFSTDINIDKFVNRCLQEHKEQSTNNKSWWKQTAGRFQITDPYLMNKNRLSASRTRARMVPYHNLYFVFICCYSGNISNISIHHLWKFKLYNYHASWDTA